MAESGTVRVTVLYSSAPRRIHEWTVELAQGGTVLQALQASGLQLAFPEVDLNSAEVGVWARKARLDQVLCDQDRVEVYRPLKIDPKLSRRERFRNQGARSAGLFARKKNGHRPAS
jgi:uncharacterized protein